MYCKKGFALLGILLSTVIICFLWYIASSTYFKKPSFDKQSQEVLSKQDGGINTANYQTILDSVKTETKDINEKLLERSRQIENIR